MTLKERASEYSIKKIEQNVKEGKKVQIGISRKQANVVFACNKQGKINVSEEVISAVYKMADAFYKNDYYNQNSQFVDDVVNGINALFDKEYEIAQFFLERAVKFY